MGIWDLISLDELRDLNEKLQVLQELVMLFKSKQE
jgi:hypothetical protein